MSRYVKTFVQIEKFVTNADSNMPPSVAIKISFYYKIMTTWPIFAFSITQKSFLPINLTIIKVKKKLHNFVENIQFYLNKHYSRKLVCNILSWSSFLSFFWPIIYSNNWNSKFSLYNFFLHILLNSNLYEFLKSVDNFLTWISSYLVTDGQTYKDL